MPFFASLIDRLLNFCVLLFDLRFITTWAEEPGDGYQKSWSFVRLDGHKARLLGRYRSFSGGCFNITLTYIDSVIGAWFALRGTFWNGFSATSSILTSQL